MPNYFADYDTTVTFISQEELDRDHAGIPHGGSVFRSGVTGENGEHTHVVEYSLKLDSNPEFTGSVLVACARAAHRLSREGVVGCKTMFDIAPAYLSGQERRGLARRDVVGRSRPDASKASLRPRRGLLHARSKRRCSGRFRAG